MQLKVQKYMLREESVLAFHTAMRISELYCKTYYVESL